MSYKKYTAMPWEVRKETCKDIDSLPLLIFAATCYFVVLLMQREKQILWVFDYVFPSDENIGNLMNIAGLGRFITSGGIVASTFLYLYFLACGYVALLFYGGSKRSKIISAHCIAIPLIVYYNFSPEINGFAAELGLINP